MFYEAPHRIGKMLEDALSVFGDRKMCLARELTKLHEEYLRRSMEEEISQLHKRITVMEERVRTLEYKVCPENVLANTEVRA